MNGVISLGSTCANTEGPSTTTQNDTDGTLDILEARIATSTTLAHAPAIFESADDYGEETTELETACRLLGNNCSYQLQMMVDNRKTISEQLKKFIPVQ